MRSSSPLRAALSVAVRRRSLRALATLAVVIVGLILIFSVGFHLIMAAEGRDFSWAGSIYWTVITMTTLGYGDIVFESDLGRLYTLVVLFSGAVLILVLLPFTFIQVVYLPWRNVLRQLRAPRRLDRDVRDHLLLTSFGPVEEALAHRAEAAGMRYVILVEDVEEASRLSEEGHPVMVGDLDEPNTYRAAHADQASMLVTGLSDERNSHVVFSVREVTTQGIVVATANASGSAEVLRLAGADHVIELGRSLGHAFARRILTPDARYREISRFEDLVIAETAAAGTELVGKSLQELNLRNRFGISVVGLWDRGRLQPATPDLRIEKTSILVFAGSDEALAAYDRAHMGARPNPDGAERARNGGPVIILGGGRVGRAAAETLRREGIPSRIVERLPDRVAHLDDVVVGDAADMRVLRKAGIHEARAVIVTTHDDDVNIFLTLYVRRLRSDVELITRARIDRNVQSMHRAGADLVLSYASIGAIEAWNQLRKDSTLLLAEGLIMFQVPMPAALAGRALHQTSIPAETGCSIVAIVQQGRAQTSLSGETVLPANGELLLIGDDHAEERFLRRYVARQRRRWWSD